VLRGGDIVGKCPPGREAKFSENFTNFGQIFAVGAAIAAIRFTNQRNVDGSEWLC
jgi:hypothetical protein